MMVLGVVAPYLHLPSLQDAHADTNTGSISPGGANPGSLEESGGTSSNFLTPTFAKTGFKATSGTITITAPAQGIIVVWSEQVLGTPGATTISDTLLKSYTTVQDVNVDANRRIFVAYTTSSGSGSDTITVSNAGSGTLFGTGVMVAIFTSTGNILRVGSTFTSAIEVNCGSATTVWVTTSCSSVNQSPAVTSSFVAFGFANTGSDNTAGGGTWTTASGTPLVSIQTSPVNAFDIQTMAYANGAGTTGYKLTDPSSSASESFEAVEVTGVQTNTVYGSSGNRAQAFWGVCFQATATGSISSVELGLGNKVGSPTGTIDVQVYSTTGTVGGNNCASLSTVVATSIAADEISMANLFAGIQANNWFRFSSGTITSGTVYIVIVDAVFTQGSLASFQVTQPDSGDTFTGYAHVDNFGTATQGSLAQAGNDNDQAACTQTNCSSFNDWIGIKLSGSSASQFTTGRIGVCFVASTTGALSDIDFYASNDAFNNAATGTFVVELYITSGSVAGGNCASQSSLLATSYTVTTQKPERLISDPAVMSFTFQSGTNMIAGNVYVAVLKVAFTQSTTDWMLMENSGTNTNSAMAYVDNFGTNPQGALNQVGNDADQVTCAANKCPAFTVFVRSTGWTQPNNLLPDCVATGSCLSNTWNVNNGAAFFTGVCFTAQNGGLLQQLIMWDTASYPMTGTVQGQIYTTTGTVGGGNCWSQRTLLESSSNTINMNAISSSSFGTAGGVTTKYQGSQYPNTRLQFNFPADKNIVAGTVYLVIIKIAATQASTQTFYESENAVADSAQAHVDSGGDVDQYTCTTADICSGYSIQVSPAAYSLSNNGPVTINGGSTGTVAITATTSGYTGSASLSCTGLPAGITCNSFSPSSGTPTFTSTLTIGVASAQASGTYTFTVTGTPPPISSTTVTVIVPAFDYKFSDTGPYSVQQNPSVQSVLTVQVTSTLTSGGTQPVTFSCTSLPSGFSCGTFSPASCSPTCSTTVPVTITAGHATGTFQFQVTGSPLGATTTPDTVTVVLSNQICPPGPNNGCGVSVNCGSNPALCNIDMSRVIATLITLSVILFFIFLLYKFLLRPHGDNEEGNEYTGVAGDREGI